MALTLLEPVPAERAEELTALFQHEWWTRGRQLGDVRRMLAGNDLSLGLIEEGRLAGFARSLTDGVYKALILDVIVARHLRGRGAGRLLMETLVHHPLLRPVRHLELHCLPELAPFYARWGFTDELGTLHLMRRTSPDPSG